MNLSQLVLGWLEIDYSTSLGCFNNLDWKMELNHSASYFIQTTYYILLIQYQATINSPTYD